MPHKPGTGAIFGVVSEDGVPKQGAPVTLLDMRREVGIGQSIILARQLTASDGGFVFNGLNTAYGDYAVYCSDEDGATPKNALIRDRITPVPAHSGSTWVHNWYVNACLLGANAILAPYPAIDGVSPRIFEYPTGNGQIMCIDTDQTPSTYGTAFAGNTLYPLFQIYPDAHVATHGRPVKKWAVPGDVQFTAEWWVDFDSIGGGTSDPAVFFGATSEHSYTTYAGFLWSDCRARDANYATYARPVFRMAISRTTKQLKVFARTDTSPSFDKFFAVDSVTPMLNYDMSALSGMHQIMMVYRSGSTSELFVDGALVATNIASPAHPFTNGSPFGYRRDDAYFPVVVGGISSDAYQALGAEFRSGPVAFYPRPLTQAQILQQYQNMTQETLPVITGYARKVFEYMPQLYYRMNDASTSSVLRTWTCYPDESRSWQHLPRVGAGSDFIYAEPSPVLGGSSIKFSGNSAKYFRTDTGGIVCVGNRHQMAFVGWVRLSATPSATAEIIEVRNWASRYACYVTVNTSRQLSLTVDIANVDQTIVFNEYTLPVDVWQFVAIVVSLYDSGRTIKLYVGSDTALPSLQSTKILTGGYMFDSYSNTTKQDYQYRITVGLGFPGWLAELALLPQALSAADVQALWEAKDTV